MKSLIPMLMIGALALVGSAVAEEADESVSDSRIEKLNLGTYWYGAKVAQPSDLVGKVVLVEIWGS